jgi:hypothetical protein
MVLQVIPQNFSCFQSRKYIDNLELEAISVDNEVIS